MNTKPILVWFRNDLRLDDHEPLLEALANGQAVPVYCFDPRHTELMDQGWRKTGAHRARFLLEAVEDLRALLRGRGGDLVVRCGTPETVLPALTAELGADAVYASAEATPDELAVEEAVACALGSAGRKLVRFWTATLFHPDDLPFAPGDVPDTFSRFRRRVERNVPVRAPRAAPAAIPALPPIDPGRVPALPEFGLEPAFDDPRALFKLRGGETAGRARLEEYVWTRDRLRVYKHTRNGMLAPHDSSKFSAWLALGCLSPRRIHEEVRRYEVDRVKNESTYWMVFELLWRDYFRFVCLRHGARVFQRGGLRALDLPWDGPLEHFHRWRVGTTGYPFIDAGMRELAATGFLSNRGRQNVASFLTKNLAVDWRLGAAWFESRLIDHDACSNWGNWNYIAGVGNDANGFRWFHVVKQAERYDPHGAYVRHWLPELREIPGAAIHAPWTLADTTLHRAGVVLGEDYPRPIVDFDASIRDSEQRYVEAAG